MTNDQLQQHVKSGEPVKFSAGFLTRMPAHTLTCTDGFEVSVQASAMHYCSPRGNDGPYDTFELGFPSAADELITEYAEDGEDLTGTVYAQVPLETVLALLNKHGGVTS